MGWLFGCLAPDRRTIARDAAEAERNNEVEVTSVCAGGPLIFLRPRERRTCCARSVHN